MNELMIQQALDQVKVYRNIALGRGDSEAVKRLDQRIKELKEMLEILRMEAL